MEVMDRNGRLRLFVDFPKADVQVRIAFSETEPSRSPASAFGLARRRRGSRRGRFRARGPERRLLLHSADETIRNSSSRVACRKLERRPRAGAIRYMARASAFAEENPVRPCMRNDGPLPLARRSTILWHCGGRRLVSGTQASVDNRRRANHRSTAGRLEWTWKTAHVISRWQSMAEAAP